MKFKLWLQNEEGTTTGSAPSAMGSGTGTDSVAHYTLPLFATAVRRISPSLLATSPNPVKRKHRRNKHSLN